MLTFEAIRELERAERESKRLQRFPDGFFEQLREYLEHKARIAEKSAMDILEEQNARSAVRRLIELRERKITEMALAAARTGLPGENLTKAEEALFSVIVDRLRAFREELLGQLDRKDEGHGKDNDQRIKEIVYLVKRSLPEFVGPDLKVYALRENEVVALPEQLAELLLKEGIIEERKE